MRFWHGTVRYCHVFEIRDTPPLRDFERWLLEKHKAKTSQNKIYYTALLPIEFLYSNWTLPHQIIAKQIASIQ